MQALGFPFGRTLNIGRDSLSSVVPEITTTSGTISSLRANDSGARRFIQSTATSIPATVAVRSSTRTALPVGVIHSRLRDATSIAFAIPINQVKEFLESRGLDQLMPTRRLRLGGVHRSDTKAVAMRLPEGLTDVSPRSIAVRDRSGMAEIALRIDRVLRHGHSIGSKRSCSAARTFERLSVAVKEAA